ncbi:MAG: hypothetical protein SBU_000672 [Candidatus Syntrophoarchaeum butanivorans]|uniref:Uncharacterized protein n=1 Tax=Candidatus Syntropharchaeum butanivorans TaxID=1839936 RepID=A0A1F2P6E1_9EURY|nr:MAG: hypothetical protein SBU_000672 [Candidatus Syntrophoarchaeum butanivorans]
MRVGGLSFFPFHLIGRLCYINQKWFLEALLKFIQVFKRGEAGTRD